MSTAAQKIVEARSEPRDTERTPNHCILIKMAGDAEYSGAIVVESSTSGLSLMTSKDIPIGARLTLNMDDTYFATADVVYVGLEHMHGFEWHGMKRVGIHFADKTNWPF